MDGRWSLGGYAVSIWLLAVVVRTLPVSTTYAVWSGVGTAAVAMVGALWLGERLDWISVSALSLIVVGVVVLNVHTARSLVSQATLRHLRCMRDSVSHLPGGPSHDPAAAPGSSTTAAAPVRPWC